MNNFKNYFVDVVTQKYFQFSGRASRREFWYFILFSIIFSIIAGVLGTALGIEYIMQVDSIKFVEATGEMVSVKQDIPLNILQLGLSLLLFFPSLAITIRRLHDIGRTGWWYLIVLIPLIGALVLLAFFVKAGQLDDNRYGEFPVTE